MRIFFFDLIFLIFFYINPYYVEILVRANDYRARRVLACSIIFSLTKSYQHYIMLLIFQQELAPILMIFIKNNQTLRQYQVLSQMLFSFFKKISHPVFNLYKHLDYLNCRHFFKEYFKHKLKIIIKVDLIKLLLRK